MITKSDALTSAMTQGAFGLPAALNVFGSHPHDLYFKNQRIVLDGYFFTNCCFDNCELVTDNGIFALRSCKLINCRVNYGPNAARIIRLWNASGPFTGQPGVWPAINGWIGPDGSLTVD